MKCRSCGAETEQVLSLGEMPLANHLLVYPSESYHTYPIDLMYCPACKLGQLAEPVRPLEMFNDYPYYASVSKPNLDSGRELMHEIYTERHLTGLSLVTEIGSNDGYLLDHYNRYAIPVLGIDPASGPANQAALRGIPTVQEYFTLKLARQMPKADVIHAHNVLAHVPDVNDFVAGIETMLKPDGVVVVEVPYLGDMVEKGTFDLIYHEHCYYFSITAICSLFFRHGMTVGKLERIPAHGGSLRVFFRKSVRGASVTSGEAFDFRGMIESIYKQTTRLKKWLETSKGRVWGFGASAKATIMLNFCQVDSRLIPCIADSTPAKIGRLLPGTGGIKVVPPERWLEEQPEWTCIFAWNYAQEIAGKYAREYKGKMFTPYALP